MIEVISLYNVLCYGDSNTWGAIPGSDKRFDRDTRWPGVLRNELNKNYRVIEEGLNGRTTVWEDPIEGCKSGKNYFTPCLETHKPLDLVIVMLGTNDLKVRFSATPYDVAEGAGRLVDIIQNSETGRNDDHPEVLLVAPPQIAQLTEHEQVFAGSREKSQQFSFQFKRVAEEKNVFFLDAGKHVNSSVIDGIHLDNKEHAKLGKAVASKVTEIKKNG